MPILDLTNWDNDPDETRLKVLSRMIFPYYLPNSQQYDESCILYDLQSKKWNLTYWYPKYRNYLGSWPLYVVVRYF